jgi:hypothetical protein
LGYIILTKRIIVDPEKIEAIREWPTPRNVSEVRSFMGLFSYYRRFIKGFSKIASQITSLQNKGVKFEWTFKCEETLKKLKGILTSAPILNIAYPYEYFFVCTDECKQVLDGVINKKDHVVCYESRKLNEYERNYATHDRELVAIIHSLKMWRHYLMGKIFELRIDHYGMKHLFEQPSLNARKTRWMEFLSEYDFELKHIKGKENKVIDALNRRSHEVHIAAINMHRKNMKDKIVVTTNSDQHYLKIKEILKQGNFQQKFNAYEVK